MAYLPADCLAVYESLGGQSVAAREHFAFREAGYFGMRTDRTYIVIDCGPPCADSLPAHGHGDILSFEWDVDGQRVVVDPGVYEYEAGPRRLESRSARSHNTVVIQGRDQCEFSSSFRVGRRAKVKLESLETSPGRLLLVGSHDGYSRQRKRLVHQREFIATGLGLKIRDTLWGVENPEIQANYLIGESIKVMELDCPGYALGSIAVLNTDAQAEVNQARISPDLGVLQSGSRIRFRGTTELQARFQVILSR